MPGDDFAGAGDWQPAGLAAAEKVSRGIGGPGAAPLERRGPVPHFHPKRSKLEQANRRGPQGTLAAVAKRKARGAWIDPTDHQRRPGIPEVKGLVALSRCRTVEAGARIPSQCI